MSFPLFLATFHHIFASYELNVDLIATTPYHEHRARDRHIRPGAGLAQSGPSGKSQGAPARTGRKWWTQRGPDCGAGTAAVAELKSQPGLLPWSSRRPRRSREVREPSPRLETPRPDRASVQWAGPSSSWLLLPLCAQATPQVPRPRLGSPASLLYPSAPQAAPQAPSALVTSRGSPGMLAEGTDYRSAYFDCASLGRLGNEQVLLETVEGGFRNPVPGVPVPRTVFTPFTAWAVLRPYRRGPRVTHSRVPLSLRIGLGAGTAVFIKRKKVSDSDARKVCG